MDRLPRSVFRHGAEPDPRFSLANERTFLAWIRTSLALVAASIALESLASTINPNLRLGAAALLVSAGLLAALQAWFGWMRTERRLRQNRPLGGATTSLVMACAVTVAIVLVVVGWLL
jgi:putative membrane protein